MTQAKDAAPQTQVFLTAAIAYPALERKFLEARSTISAGFRVFDPRTKLRSDEGQAIGADWYDLVCHTLARGVSFRLILTDFDPVARPSEHRMTWASARRWFAAAEASGRPDLFTFYPAMHPARIGRGSSMLLWPKVMKEISAETRRLNDLPNTRAARDLSLMPRLARHITGAHPKLRPDLTTLPRLVPTTHHQKVAVFDNTSVYIGGLDLDERRYDNPDHDRAGEDTWRDCQIMTDGPLAAEVTQHLSEVLDVTAGRKTPSPTKHLLRTLSAPQPHKFFTLSPRTVLSEIDAALIAQLKTVQDLIYIETQFFRSLPLAKAMCAASKANPDLRALLIVPAAPEDVAFHNSTKSDARYGEYLQAKCLDLLTNTFGDRLFVASPAQMRAQISDDRSVLKSAPLIYVHAKVSIFDDTAAIVSSANLNGRSLRWDTEVGTTLTRKADVTHLRATCLAHWVPDDITLDPADAVASVRALATGNATTTPDSRKGFLLPYPVAPARRFGRNLPGVPEDMA